MVCGWQLSEGAAGQGFPEVEVGWHMLLLVVLSCCIMLLALIACASDYLTSTIGPRALEAGLAAVHDAVAACRDITGRAWDHDGRRRAWGGSSQFEEAHDPGFSKQRAHQSAAPGEFEDSTLARTGVRQPPITSYV